MHRALLDTIAFAEGTLGAGGKDGYNVAFSFKLFGSCNAHPNISSPFRDTSSSAAGRYQFLNDTWRGLKLPNFWPENQDRGAMQLVRGQGVQVPTDRPLSQAEFEQAMQKLSWVWASIPPSRYSQPVKALSTLRAKYCEFARCGESVGSDGCTNVERTNAAMFGCQCVNHQPSGGYCDGSGCTAQEERNCASVGTQCVDHKCSGGFTEGTGCTAREEKNCASVGTQCVDHKCSGGFTEGSGCTALEEKNCAAFGTQCVDHKCSGGFGEGNGCTARQNADCEAKGQRCYDHLCLAK